MNSTTPRSILVDLSDHHLQFDGRGNIRADQRRMAGDDADWRLALFRVETPDDVHADQWEMHPLADEAVCCLHGAIRLYFRATQPETPDDVVHMGPGGGVIVPRGRWHRFELDEPTNLLAVTVRRGTELDHAGSPNSDRPRTSGSTGSRSRRLPVR